MSNSVSTRISYVNPATTHSSRITRAALPSPHTRSVFTSAGYHILANVRFKVAPPGKDMTVVSKHVSDSCKVRFESLSAIRWQRVV